MAARHSIDGDTMPRQENFNTPDLGVGGAMTGVSYEGFRDCLDSAAPLEGVDSGTGYHAMTGGSYEGFRDCLDSASRLNVNVTSPALFDA